MIGTPKRIYDKETFYGASLIRVLKNILRCGNFPGNLFLGHEYLMPVRELITRWSSRGDAKRHAEVARGRQRNRL